MRRSNPVKIGDLWDDFLKSAPTIARKIAEAKVPDIWPSVVGNRIAMYTASVKVEKGILIVKMTSAPARSELFMRRSELRERINAALRMDVIRDVVVK